MYALCGGLFRLTTRLYGYRFCSDRESEDVSNIEISSQYKHAETHAQKGRSTKRQTVFDERRRTRFQKLSRFRNETRTCFRRTQENRCDGTARRIWFIR